MSIYIYSIYPLEQLEPFFVAFWKGFNVVEGEIHLMHTNKKELQAGN